MKITKVDCLLLRPLDEGWTPIFVRVYTDAGIYGDGEIALSYGGVGCAAFGIVQDMAKLVIGMDPLDHEVIWQKLYLGNFWSRNGGPLNFGGIGAFDMAMWDIKGKYLNMPVYKLLGGKQRSRLHCYASQLQKGWDTGRYRSRTPEDYAKNCKIAVERGFDAVKINFITYRNDGTRYEDSEQKGLLSREFIMNAEERIAASREALGPNGELILENHCLTDARGAIQYGNMAKKYDILYFEEPTVPHPHLLRQVYEGCGIPVASGERIYGRWQYNRCFQEGAVQVAQPDLGNCGGITEVKKICDLAYIYESSVQVHVCGSPLVTAASLHVEAAIPNFQIHEYNVNTMLPEMLKCAKYNYQPVGGYYEIPELPGISNEISDWAYGESEIATIGG